MSVPEPVRRERLLVDGLVGPHRELYHHSASFRAAVKVLAQMLPLMVEGLAADARQRREHRQEQLETLTRPGVFPIAIAELADPS